MVVRRTIIELSMLLGGCLLGCVAYKPLTPAQQKAKRQWYNDMAQLAREMNAVALLEFEADNPGLAFTQSVHFTGMRGRAWFFVNPGTGTPDAVKFPTTGTNPK